MNKIFKKTMKSLILLSKQINLQKNVFHIFVLIITVCLNASYSFAITNGFPDSEVTNNEAQTLESSFIVQQIAEERTSVYELTIPEDNYDVIYL